VSAVSSRTTHPCRRHSRRKASPLKYVAMHRMVGIWLVWPRMRREQHGWYSHRLGRHMAIVVHGHWGPPLIMFPTSGGDEGEYERQSMIGAIAEFIDAGRVKAFCVNVNQGDSFANRGAHPFHRSWMQRQYDAYIRHEVIPFIRHHCRSDEIGV